MYKKFGKIYFLFLFRLES